ncbi:MAG: extracellular solute-binding protein [Pirellula sp.]|nr:extracellular solute-binding protein [Pirellula sp.]
MSNNRYRSLSISALLILLTLSLGCSTKYENQVVISVDAKQTYASPILASFTRQFPQDEFQVVKRNLSLGFYENTSQPNEASESMNPEGDVVWDSDLLRTIQRQTQGLLKARKWTISRDWPDSFRASDGSWVAFAARARVLLINDQVIDPAAIPSSICDLGSPQWKDQCGIASLDSPSVRAHLAIIAAYCDSIKPAPNQALSISNDKQTLDFEKWLDRLSQNTKIYNDEKQVALAVARGEIHWAIVDSDEAVALQDQNETIRIAFPDQADDGFGTVLIPNTVSVLASAKNPKVAGRLADFLVSNEVEARLTISDSATIPLNPTPKELSRLLKGLDIKWAKIQLEDLPNAWENVVNRSAEKLRPNRRD